MGCCGWGKKKNKKGQKAGGANQNFARPYNPATSQGHYQQQSVGYPAPSQQQRKTDPVYDEMAARNQEIAKMATKYAKHAPGPQGKAFGTAVRVAAPLAAKGYTQIEYNRTQRQQQPQQPQQQEMSQPY